MDAVGAAVERTQQGTPPRRHLPFARRPVRQVVAALGIVPVVVVAAACAAPTSDALDGPAVVQEPSQEPRATPPSKPSTPPSTTPTPPPTAPSAAAAPARGAQQLVLHPGDTGADVREVQHRLSSLGYWLGAPDGQYGHLTEQAVIALQKAAGLNRDGVFGEQTRAALDQGVQPQHRRTVGSGVEVDLRRQLMLQVSNGELTSILNASTGSGTRYLQAGVPQVAITPMGKYTVYREVNGQDDGPLGSLWRPKYIVGGVAIHGYSSVPSYPASHGCIRVSLSAMDHLWNSGTLPIGSSVWVY